LEEPVDYTELLTSAVDVLTPVVLALLSWLSVAAARWIQNKVKNDYAQGVLLRLNDAVFTAVRALQQTTVQAIKDANKDGKIDAKEAAAIKEKALGQVKSYMGQKGIDQLKGVLAFDDLEDFLSARIEAELHKMKVEGATKPPAVAPAETEPEPEVAVAEPVPAPA
jgi:hypothetical protein